MFSNLKSTDPNRYFTNSLAGYNGHNQKFKNILVSVLDATNGLTVHSGETVSITSVKVTEQRALSAQFWFKGTVSDGLKIASVHKDLSTQSVYLERSGNTMVLKSTYDAAKEEIIYGVGSALDDSTGWKLFGLSVGWMGYGNDFMI